MQNVPLALFAIPIFSTLAGGLLAMQLRRYFNVLTAMGAGLLLGAAFLDLLPEALTLGQRSGMTISSVLGLTLLSFLFFLGLDTLLHSLEVSVQDRHGAGVIRRAGVLLLIFHSFRDGMAIGAAFAASHTAGYVVALGIATHDLGDGMNTVILTTRGEPPTLSDYLFLVADAVAPFLGGLLTAWWVLSQRSSVYILVLAAGFFLQLATGDFLPELSRGDGARRYLLPTVLLGAAIVYAANLLILHH